MVLKKPENSMKFQVMLNSTKLPWAAGEVILPGRIRALLEESHEKENYETSVNVINEQGC
jgi:hypothetical protein